MCPFLKLTLASRRARIGGQDAKPALSVCCDANCSAPGDPVESSNAPQSARPRGLAAVRHTSNRVTYAKAYEKSEHRSATMSLYPAHPKIVSRASNQSTHAEGL